jgi:hypothetical protein
MIQLEAVDKELKLRRYRDHIEGSVRPFENVNLVIQHADERCMSLFHRAWSVIPEEDRDNLISTWDSFLGAMTIDFAEDWPHKQPGDVGVRWSKSALVQYDIRAIHAMPDELALVLITHELVHELLGEAYQSDELDEIIVRETNDEWYRQYVRRLGYQGAVDGLSVEDDLTAWLKANESGRNQSV